MISSWETPNALTRCGNTNERDHTWVPMFPICGCHHLHHLLQGIRRAQWTSDLERVVVQVHLETLEMDNGIAMLRPRQSWCSSCLEFVLSMRDYLFETIDSLVHHFLSENLVAVFGVVLFASKISWLEVRPHC